MGIATATHCETFLPLRARRRCHQSLRLECGGARGMHSARPILPQRCLKGTETTVFLSMSLLLTWTGTPSLTNQTARRGVRFDTRCTAPWPSRARAKSVIKRGRKTEADRIVSLAQQNCSPQTTLYRINAVSFAASDPHTHPLYTPMTSALY
jgi:hypothetical protein